MRRKYMEKDVERWLYSKVNFSSFYDSGGEWTLRSIQSSFLYDSFFTSTITISGGNIDIPGGRQEYLLLLYHVSVDSCVTFSLPTFSSYPGREKFHLVWCELFKQIDFSLAYHLQITGEQNRFGIREEKNLKYRQMLMLMIKEGKLEPSESFESSWSWFRCCLLNRKQKHQTKRAKVFPNSLSLSLSLSLTKNCTSR